MAVELIGTDDFGRAQYKGLSSDTKPNAEVGSTYIETDTHNKYEQRSTGAAGWKQIDVGGAASVVDGFRPSSYTGNVTASTTVTGQSVAIATGASRLRIRNLDATNYALVAFGTSAVDAESNAVNGVAIEFGQSELVGIPANATHFAYLGNTGSVVLNIQQGV